MVTERNNAMKRTDLERRERELKRSQKKETLLQKKSSGEAKTIGDYIDELHSLFRYDDQEIFNTTSDVAILELFEELKTDYPEKQWENILRKAIKKTKVSQKDKAYNELMGLLN